MKPRIMKTQERLNPPLLPPLPKRTLGGTNFRADIVDVRLSISLSRDVEFAFPEALDFPVASKSVAVIEDCLLPSSDGSESLVESGFRSWNLE